MVVVAAIGLVEEAARWRGSSSGGFVLGGLFLEMTDDLVDDRGLNDDRNDFHYFAAFGTQEWVSLEDHSDQACPGSSARRGGCGGSICVMFRARVRGLRQIFLKQSLTCSIGVGPIKPCEVLAMVWDLLTNGMNPIEDIEVYNG